MRILLFILIALTGFLAPWWPLLPLALLYALRYTAYELLLLGIALDASYGSQVFQVALPIIYTSGAFLVLIVTETFKPRLKNM